MAEQIIFGLVGEQASGKGEASKYIKERYGAASYRFSTPMRDILNRVQLPLTRENLQDVSTILRKRFGQDLFVNAIMRDIKYDPTKIIIVEGIRLLIDTEKLSQLPNFKLIYIDTSPEARFARLKHRGENTDDHLKTFEDFEKDHEKETEQQIIKLKMQANYVIDNEGSLTELHKKLDNIIKGGL
ncbi:MAG: AAA family ATPase [bacterium]